jgi:uncharacterized MnhB-related membrane protein|nr:DoxX family protein [Kofleriaceae bacterium]
MTHQISNRARWGSRIITGLVGLFLAVDVVFKFVDSPQVAEASAHLGLPGDVTAPIGVVLAVCLALYLVPRTAVLGAVLLTGYLGGAVAIHVRVGDPIAAQALFPVYFGVLIWLALYLRDPRVRALVAPRESVG